MPSPGILGVHKHSDIALAKVTQTRERAEFHIINQCLATEPKFPTKKGRRDDLPILAAKQSPG